MISFFSRVGDEGVAPALRFRLSMRSLPPQSADLESTLCEVFAEIEWLELARRIRLASGAQVDAESGLGLVLRGKGTPR